jgi:aerobic-type carbon monoxide dehydrogenase small subunit (CoxS/CutS family)
MKKDKSKTSSGISRRGFLRGAGLTTAGTVLLNQNVLGLDPGDIEKKGEMNSAEGQKVTLSINGDKYSLLVEPRTTLSAALRDTLGMTGTKVVCDRGSCSACTVFLDGKPINSCMVLAIDVKGKEITTIEGISKGDELHPVQEEFINHDASQCGYCTPGMIMSSVHLLKNNPNPSLTDVKQAVRGNLCRCGTYPHVFKAVLEASKKI